MQGHCGRWCRGRLCRSYQPCFWFHANDCCYCSCEGPQDIICRIPSVAPFVCLAPPLLLPLCCCVTVVSFCRVIQNTLLKSFVASSLPVAASYVSCFYFSPSTSSLSVAFQSNTTFAGNNSRHLSHVDSCVNKHLIYIVHSLQGGRKRSSFGEYLQIFVYE